MMLVSIRKFSVMSCMCLSWGFFFFWIFMGYVFSVNELMLLVCFVLVVFVV